jgi:hypothetical protein
MLRSLTIGTFVLVGVAAVAHAADVFRWVDDHGGVHYSDQWVPGSEVIKSSKPRPTGGSDTASRTPDTPKFTAAPSAPAQQNAAQAVKQDLTKMREQQCKEAKDRYDKAIQARRIFKQGESDKAKDTDRPDDRQYLSDEEADAYRVKARQEMQELCGK